MVIIKTICDQCHHEGNVYDLDWTHIICSKCGEQIENNLFEEDLDKDD